MALTLFDIKTDTTREATQADLDALEAMAQAYGSLRTAVADTHARLLTQIEDIKRRHQPVIDDNPAPVVAGA